MSENSTGLHSLQAKRRFLVLPDGLTAEDITALQMIADERARQIAVEGFTPEHDDRYRNGELEVAGGEYLQNAGLADGCYPPGNPSGMWPWPAEWWKPKSRISDGVRGCALGVAGISARLRRGERAEG